MSVKDEFLSVYGEHIKREGADKLKEYLIKSDFFTAPASTRYHCAYEGGLAEHSLNTYKRLVRNMQAEYGDEWEQHFSRECIAICGLLHDVCKIEYYKTDTKNVKVDGAWQTVPYFRREEKLPYGHGEKSVYIINGFLRLDRTEALAINWHMGGFDARLTGGTVSEAFSLSPLIPLLHVSDLQATFIDERRSNKHDA